MSALNIETKLQNALKTLCDRVYPDVAPAGLALPYVVWHMYGGQSVAYTSGPLAARRNAFVQINVWGDSRLQCNDLSLQIAQLLTDQAASPTGMQAEAISELTSAFDEETKLRGAMQDFSLWADR